MKTTIVYTSGKINYPPIGSLYLADALNKQGIDCDLLPSSTSFKNLEEKIKENPNSPINMSVITSPEISNFVNLSKQVKENYPNTPIIWGGIHPSINPEQCVNESYIDYVISGDGEKTLPKVVKQLINGDSVRELINSEKIDNLDEFSPMWDKVKPVSQFIFPEQHFKHGGNKVDISQNFFYYLFTSRGCSFDCSFCSSGRKDGNKLKYHSPQWVENQIDEIQSRLSTNGEIFGGIGIWDDMFFGNLNRSTEILNLLKRKNINYIIEARADQLLNKGGKLLEQLIDTGCSQVFVGAESADQKTLDYLNKRTNVNDYYKLIKLAEKNKFDTRFSLITGFPYESDKSVNKTLDFSKEIRDTKYCSVSGPKLFTPYPGTLEYERAIERGFKSPESTEEWSKIHRRTENYNSMFPWLKENLSNKTLDRMELEVRK